MAVLFSEIRGAIIFDVRVVTRAARSEIIGEFDGALKIKIAAPPIEGAANAELIKVLAKYFGAAKSRIEIVGGLTSKNKRVKIQNLGGETFLKLLGG